MRSGYRHRFPSRSHTQFVEHVRNVGVDSAATNVQQLGNLAIGMACRKEMENLAFATRQQVI